MERFRRQLDDRQPDPSGRRWLFVPYDQLSARIGPLATEDPADLGIVVVESPWKAGRRSYHRQKLALVIANLRHFALEQAERGLAVRHVVHDGPYAEALAGVAQDVGSMRVQRPAERELRRDLASLVEDGTLEVVDHAGWLTSREQFEASQDGPPWRMDAFYRHVRRESGILMEDGSPAGGKYSHDADNREAWDGDPPAPDPPRFTPDDVTREVADLVEERFADHPGRVDLESLPATADDAKATWDWALRECLPRFGPYQDAMSRETSSLFHTRISPLLHLHRLLPRDVVDDVLDADVPLQSREGFVRQVLGWREFVRHVHDATDGFANHDLDALGADADLPAAFWQGAWPDQGDRPSGLECLDRVVGQVWEEGYGHHITRLMVAANLATLLGVSPRQLTDWFWVAYIDAYDWVVEPNVLGMGSYALGDLMTTKPYVCGANYIDKMGDFCAACRFDPKGDCPITALYWAFLDRHRERLADNPRMRLPLASCRKRGDTTRDADRVTYEAVRATLSDGSTLAPDELAAERDG